jgi:hypothetical protein
MLNRIREYDPNIRMKANNITKFHTEHNELSKIISAIKKGWVIQYFYPEETIRQIQQPIECEFKSEIWKYDGNVSKELELFDSMSEGYVTIYPHILTREEVLEVYENYYRYTVKTNESGDFMIWGVPVGTQTLHVDLDLSDIGCFSLRPYDFIKRGEGIEKFERYYEFKSNSDIDGLPQIIKYDRTIEVFPFWGNLDLCEIGITRVDYDISQSGIRI